MKKLMVTFAAVVILASAFSLPAEAHHGNGGHRQGRNAPQCTIDNCVETGSHMHDSNTYSGHISYCTVSGCTEGKVHEHDGVTYGRCLNQCGVDDCSVSENHVHDGNAYCGNHNSGTWTNSNCGKGYHGGNHY